jgi:hypothetical protein
MIVMNGNTENSNRGSPQILDYFTQKRYTVTMTDAISIQGRLVALHWPSQASEVTLSFDMNKTQLATAEIEDAEGITHHIHVQVMWEADSLVGKMVKTTSCDDGTSLCCSE